MRRSDVSGPYTLPGLRQLPPMYSILFEQIVRWIDTLHARRNKFFKFKVLLEKSSVSSNL
jgi:hypothetical protein